MLPKALDQLLGRYMSYSFFRRKLAGIEFIECPGDPEAPVIIFCHGYGASADHLTFFPTMCVCANLRPTWVFPHGIEQLPYQLGGGRAWFPLDTVLFEKLISSQEITPDTDRLYQQLLDVDFEKPKQALEGLIHELERDRSEVIIGGFSQGAMMTTHLMLSSRLPYRGALICSGAAVPNQSWEENASLCGKTPYIQSHGYDDPILPYFLGERLYKVLTASLKGEMVSFHGGHEIPVVMMQKIQESIALWSQST
ncbi:putative esterase [Chlamydia trachomatis L1/1322/p2]|nr:hydrolase [Chlamydia trachomatis L2/434/Bu(i)]AGJ65432.2 hydrolase [Chlamydia trachomatis L2/434/Bu(f)]CCP51426.1 putative esterase [Chlamydia trachomatis L2b/8200/07]CCP61279.1 putative esterase [Chlamydia trachomatis L2b/795]CCP63062.1 putative esterase [Chlamydia trachomatis L1/1322/p2]CCP63952.1 putative esterase [Chlamydia trachomatis L1/115]CCP64841.1 putative esterase [Chlamydia trachomatis L1/224]CCP65731.1 putative esterase [Chlamydia trachomatis L2/25667R]CCP66621.1 putative es